ncbi:urease accessory protein UreD [Steroidobacter sp. S1-65]|uniref:Urease accessory protein UreD n=1 Tax=Steroidobacter gossypii TaxID=2805490 RepID=A0ABS1WUX7_9GAMM|nr:urease accessory protein UreD [Steroidobacter gossypii]MBM0104786.1 urease accessory protein UreD [Steroidobacter gossypii]
MSATLEHPSAQGWRAQLQLTFARRAGRTRIVERQHRGPLLVQRPFYPEEDVCHAYIVHPPGGVVGGDELALNVDVRDGAHALITTPAAAKFYRSNGRTARQQQLLRSHDTALEWLPQESIFYPEAKVRSTTRIELSAGAKFIGWEIACLGLPARRQQFIAGELHLHLELWVDGTPLLIDRLRIAEGNQWGLGGHEAIGTMVAYPATRAMVDAVRELTPTGVETGVTLVDKTLICRALAAQGEPIKQAFIENWQTLRPQLLDRAATPPRIWAT